MAVECVSLLFYSMLFRRLLGLLRYPLGLALVLVYRLINFWLPIPIGLGAYLSLR